MSSGSCASACSSMTSCDTRHLRERRARIVTEVGRDDHADAGRAYAPERVDELERVQLRARQRRRQDASVDGQRGRERAPRRGDAARERAGRSRRRLLDRACVPRIARARGSPRARPGPGCARLPGQRRAAAMQHEHVVGDNVLQPDRQAALREVDLLAVPRREASRRSRRPGRALTADVKAVADERRDARAEPGRALAHTRGGELESDALRKVRLRAVPVRNRDDRPVVRQRRRRGDVACRSTRPRAALRASRRRPRSRS